MMTKSDAVLRKLDDIEAEMKRLNYWAVSPPDLLKDVKSGVIRSYIDAPSFELWLQCIFIPNVLDSVKRNKFPEVSQVAKMAVVQHEFHNNIKQTLTLFQLLDEFDHIIENN
jgi:uncharacterized protein YqcC (DUF446 family)